MNTKSFWIAAVLAGIIMGLMSNLPNTALINLFCFAGVWLSGILAVWCYRNLEPGQPELDPRQGAVLGAMAGIAGAPVGALAAMAFPGVNFFLALQVLGSLPEVRPILQLIPPGALEILQIGFFNLLVAAAWNILHFPFFGALGGWIAAGLLWKSKSFPQS